MTSSATASQKYLGPSANPVKRAGMIGLGAMGLQMALHMKSKGLDVLSSDINADATKRAQAQGLSTTSSAEVARHAEVIVVMVATDAQVQEVTRDLLQNVALGTVVCVASTVSPETCRAFAAQAAERNIGALDTPVVLGQEAANSGTMTVYVGGEPQWFARAKPVLSAFGSKVLHLGGIGTGQIAKTLNNMLLWACMAANFEMLTLAKELGVDVPRLVEALGQGSGANWSLSCWGRSTGKWAAKDMDVALEIAQDAKVAVPLAGLVDQLMKSINQERMRALLT